MRLPLLFILLLLIGAVGSAGADEPVYRVGVVTVGAEPTTDTPLGAGLVRGFERSGLVPERNLVLVEPHRARTSRPVAGPDVSEMFDRAAELAVRILKGADPAELPLRIPDPVCAGDQSRRRPQARSRDPAIAGGARRPGD
jgi:hypothetical protein